MTRWPICPLCQEETVSLDGHGLCQKISITHQAVRNPEDYPADEHPELWELILSGRPVFGTRFAVPSVELRAAA